LTAIAGIAAPNAGERVQHMLAQMAHRGPQGSLVRPSAAVTMGVSWPAGQPEAGDRLKSAGRAEDIVSDSHYAWAAPEGDSFTLERDPLGISPLYYGWNEDGHLCFASEVKGLAGQVQQVRELPPARA